MVEEKGMRNPRRPRSVGLPDCEVRRYRVLGEERTYQDVWQDLLWELKVGRRDVHIGRDSVGGSFGGLIHYAHA
jgi:hypothetical protein